MRVRLNGITARLLGAILAPVVLPLKALSRLRGERKPAYAGTIEGDPLAYTGDRPLVIAVWASYASIWKATGPQTMQALAAEFGDRCELAYVEYTGKAVREAYGVEIVPTFLIYRNGREVARFVNAMNAGEIRAALASQISQQ